MERVGDQWHSGKDSTESLRQLRILASGYIRSLEKAVASIWFLTLGCGVVGRGEGR